MSSLRSHLRAFLPTLSVSGGKGPHQGPMVVGGHEKARKAAWRPIQVGRSRMLGKVTMLTRNRYGNKMATLVWTPKLAIFERLRPMDVEASVGEPPCAANSPEELRRSSAVFGSPLISESL